MGFDRRNLPELEDLKRTRQRFNDDKKFIKFVVGKADVLVGPSESHRYIEEVYLSIKKEAEVND